MPSGELSHPVSFFSGHEVDSTVHHGMELLLVNFVVVACQELPAGGGIAATNSQEQGKGESEHLFLGV